MVFEYQDLVTMKYPGGRHRLMHTPVKIDGVKGTDLVDSGANYYFATKAFVKKNGTTIIQIKGDIQGGTGRQMADRDGTETVLVKNGAV